MPRDGAQGDIVYCLKLTPATEGCVAMAEIAQVKLSEFFRSVKNPRYVLGTTYTLSLAFFESVVFSSIDRRNLKYCLIISDMDGYRRSLAEGAAGSSNRPLICSRERFNLQVGTLSLRCTISAPAMDVFCLPPHSPSRPRR